MAGDYLVDRSTATILGAIGLLILFVTWKSRSGKFESMAPVGWVLTGFYFFNDIGFYLAHDDIVLTVMSAITLPGACAIAIWERQVSRKDMLMHYVGSEELLLLQVYPTL